MLAVACFPVSIAYLLLVVPFAVDAIAGYIMLVKAFRGHNGNYVQPKELVFENSNFETI